MTDSPVEAALVLGWTFELDREHRACLLGAAQLSPGLAGKSWESLSSIERERLLRVARTLLEVAECLSGDLSGVRSAR